MTRSSQSPPILGLGRAQARLPTWLQRAAAAPWTIRMSAPPGTSSEARVRRSTNQARPQSSEKPTPSSNLSVGAFSVTVRITLSEEPSGFRRLPRARYVAESVQERLSHSHNRRHQRHLQPRCADAGRRSSAACRRPAAVTDSSVGQAACTYHYRLFPDGRPPSPVH